MPTGKDWQIDWQFHKHMHPLDGKTGSEIVNAPDEAVARGLVKLEVSRQLFKGESAMQAYVSAKVHTT